jgi:hypothetical protein
MSPYISREKREGIRKRERREKVLTHPFLSHIKINLDVNEFVLEREDQ